MGRKPALAVAAALLVLAGLLLGFRHDLARILDDPRPAIRACPTVHALTQTHEGKNTITINEQLRGEDFVLLSPVMAHEVLHDDAELGQAEEVFATALSVALYAQMLAKLPADDAQRIVESRTCLAVHYNTLLLAAINSGPTRRLNVLPARTGGDVFPGGAIRVDSLNSYVRDYLYPGLPDIPTPGNEAVDDILIGILHRQVHVEFDDHGLRVLDQAMERALTDDQVLRLFDLLELRA